MDKLISDASLPTPYRAVGWIEDVEVHSSGDRMHCWVGARNGALLAVQVDHVVFHGRVTDYQSSRIASLFKCLTDDRLAAFLGTNIGREFFDDIEERAAATHEIEAALTIDGTQVPAVRKHFESFAATWPVDYRQYPLLIVEMPISALTTIELEPTIP
ncbi:hypothetical protein EDF46_3612 [Frondihabitans sp. PhB188]|uniref:hypothetical protein n=1 Tax=Frondihabitans sp. PhB188 TaxID=2485200 RepID=UPI000FB5F7C0|nr:hypothetical protein [Frondihabitans sp. PhB188]ROQ30295.1 hypothetical protein EDF46_3612 [Frondihabitans sp. PhB188]